MGSENESTVAPAAQPAGGDTCRYDPGAPTLGHAAPPTVTATVVPGASHDGMRSATSRRVPAAGIVRVMVTASPSAGGGAEGVAVRRD